MNKKLLSCIMAFMLVWLLAFSAGAVCARRFAADAILPFDGEVLGEEDETVIPEDPTVVIYGSEQAPALTDAEAEPEKDGSLVKSVLVCVVIGLVIALIVTLSVKSSYKPVQRKRDAAQYLVGGSFHVTASEETLVRSETSERSIQNNNSSGE